MAMLVPLHFWIDARTTLDKIKKLFWLAECEEISYHAVFDATYTWKFLHQMEAFWRQHTNIHGLVEVLDYYRDMFPPNAFHAYFTTNHDENSHSGSEYERMGSAAKTFAVLCCTLNGIPLIYSGQELPNLKRLKFFDKDRIDWTGEYKLHDFYRRLLELRKRNSALMAGSRSETIRLATNADNYILAYLRKNGDDEVLVLLNLSHEEKPLIKITDEVVTGEFMNIFSGIASDFTDHRYFALRPWEYLVYEKCKQ
jgi:glycosidase